MRLSAASEVLVKILIRSAEFIASPSISELFSAKKSARADCIASSSGSELFSAKKSASVALASASSS